MKLRARLDKQTKIINLEDNNATVEALKEAVKDQFSISSFQLSLNREQPIENSGCILKDLGIVSGDLVYVVTDDRVGTGPRSQPSCTPKFDVSKNESIPVSGKLPEDEAVADVTPGNMASTSHSEHRAEEMETGTDAEPVQDETANQLLREPLLIGESSERDGLPQCVVHTYGSADVKNDKEAFCVICHIMMVEVGYVGKVESGGAAANENPSKYAFPSGWKIPGSYRFNYYYPHMDDVQFSLVLVPLGNVIMIHGSAEQGGQTHLSQMQVKPSDYVKDLSLGPGSAYNLAVLKKLSHQFKDTIAYPLLHNTLSENSPVVPRLDCLVLELKLQILTHLDMKSLLAVSKVCRRLNSASNETVLWRRLFLKDFGRRSDNDLSQDWRKLYADNHQFRRDSRRYTAVRPPPVVPHLPFFSQPPDFPVAPTPPGFIIGGDYDRDPSFGGLVDPMGRGRYPPGGVGPLGPHPHMPRPRYDPINPDHQFRPGRGGGMWDEMQPRPGRGGGMWDEMQPPGRRRRDPFGGGGGFGGGFL